MIYKIYKCQNKENGKIYIGKTSTSVEQRMKGHIKNSKSSKNLCVFHKALRKYGIDLFIIEEICSTKSSTNINFLESFFILEFNCCILNENSNGYNMTYGGDGFDSETVSYNNKLRVLNGTHPWAGEQGSNLNRKTQQKLIDEGTHHFAGEKGSIFAKENLRKRTERGDNPWAGERGSEHSKRVAAKCLVEGRHHSQKIHTCPHCNKIGTGNAMLKWHFEHCRLKSGNELRTGSIKTT